MAKRTERQNRLKELKKEERINKFSEIRSEIKKMRKYEVDPLSYINEHIADYRKRKKQLKMNLEATTDKIKKGDLRQEINVMDKCILELEKHRKQFYNDRRHQKPALDGIEKRKLLKRKNNKRINLKDTQ